MAYVNKNDISEYNNYVRRSISTEKIWKFNKNYYKLNGEISYMSTISQDVRKQKQVNVKPTQSSPKNRRNKNPNNNHANSNASNTNNTSNVSNGSNSPNSKRNKKNKRRASSNHQKASKIKSNLNPLSKSFVFPEPAPPLRQQQYHRQYQHRQPQPYQYYPPGIQSNTYTYPPVQLIPASQYTPSQPVEDLTMNTYETYSLFPTERSHQDFILDTIKRESGILIL